MYLLPRRRPDTITRLTASAARNGTRALGVDRRPVLLRRGRTMDVPSAADGCRRVTRYKLYCISCRHRRRAANRPENRDPGIGNSQSKGHDSHTRGGAWREPHRNNSSSRATWQGPQGLVGLTRTGRAATGNGERTTALPFSGRLPRKRSRCLTENNYEVPSEPPQVCSNTTQTETAAGSTRRRAVIRHFFTPTKPVDPKNDRNAGSQHPVDAQNA
jgi:hypothetical protein